MKTRKTVIIVVAAAILVCAAGTAYLFLTSGILRPGERIETAILLTEDEQELSQAEIDEIEELLSGEIELNYDYPGYRANTSIIPVLTLKTSLGRTIEIRPCPVGEGQFHIEPHDACMEVPELRKYFKRYYDNNGDEPEQGEAGSSDGELDQDTPVVWKESPNGLAIGVRRTGELALEVCFENHGDSEILGVIQYQARFIVELNGKYYAMEDYGGPTSWMPPGRKYGPVEIDMSRFWEIPKLRQAYTMEPNDSHPVLKSGKNTLRLHYKLEDELIPSAEMTIDK
jgi:hypothetical protein